MLNKKLDTFFSSMEKQGLKLTYGDVRMATNYSEVLPPQVDVTSRFSKNVPLQIPIISSAMDTVTEASMAIALAVQGGLGIIHKNLDPEIQGKHVKRVKHYLNGLISTPIFIQPHQTLGEVQAMRIEKKYNFDSFPVIDDSGVLLGMLTGSDFKFSANDEALVRDVMTPYSEGFITAPPSMSIKDAYKRMQEHKKNVMPLVDDSRKVVGMYVFSDLKRILSDQSTHNVDENGHLRVGAAIGAGSEALTRADILVPAGCDVLVIDTAHGDSIGVIETLKTVKEKYPDTDVVAGNVSNGESVKRLIKAGADGILVGQGPGSICTTRVVAGIGCPQVSAVYDCAQAAKGSGVPVSADGGIQHPGDIAIALAVGAESVVLGSLLAGTDESPGEVEQHGLKRVKVYRGMGSLGAMHDRVQSRARYGQADVATDKLVPEGVEGHVAYVGPLSEVLVQYVGGPRAGMAYMGAKNLEEFREKAELFRITNAGLAESHPHDLV
jgi:IMP dehydrogenase